MEGFTTYIPPIDSIEKNGTLSDDKYSYLYKNYAQMRAKQLGVGGDDIYVKMVFDNRSNSLKIGTPIEFKSFQVGTIIDIKDRFNRDSREIDSVVDALIHKSAFELNSSSGLISLIESGLSAKVKSDIPFMGIDHIELFFGKARDGYRYSVVDRDTYIKVVEVRL